MLHQRRCVAKYCPYGRHSPHSRRRATAEVAHAFSALSDAPGLGIPTSYPTPYPTTDVENLRTNESTASPTTQSYGRLRTHLQTIYCTKYTYSPMIVDSSL